MTRIYFAPGKARRIACVAVPALVILPARIEYEGRIQDGHLHQISETLANLQPETTENTHSKAAASLMEPVQSPGILSLQSKCIGFKVSTHESAVLSLHYAKVIDTAPGRCCTIAEMKRRLNQ